MVRIGNGGRVLSLPLFCKARGRGCAVSLLPLYGAKIMIKFNCFYNIVVFNDVQNINVSQMSRASRVGISGNSYFRL